MVSHIKKKIQKIANGVLNKNKKANKNKSTKKHKMKQTKRVISTKVIKKGKLPRNIKCTKYHNSAKKAQSLSKVKKTQTLTEAKTSQYFTNKAKTQQKITPDSSGVKTRQTTSQSRYLTRSKTQQKISPDWSGIKKRQTSSKSRYLTRAKTQQKTSPDLSASKTRQMTSQDLNKVKKCQGLTEVKKIHALSKTKNLMVLSIKPLTRRGLNSLNNTEIQEKLKTPEQSIQLPSTQLEFAQYPGLQSTSKFKCGSCKLVFLSKFSLRKHLKNCLQNNKHLFSSEEIQLSSKKKKLYFCCTCKKRFDQSSLFVHLKVVHKSLLCIYCFKGFKVNKRLLRHLIEDHSKATVAYESLEKITTDTKQVSHFLCSRCENTFHNQNDYITHLCRKPLTSKDPVCKNCKLHFPLCLCKRHVRFSTSKCKAPEEKIAVTDKCNNVSIDATTLECMSSKYKNSVIGKKKPNRSTSHILKNAGSKKEDVKEIFKEHNSVNSPSVDCTIFKNENVPLDAKKMKKTSSVVQNRNMKKTSRVVQNEILDEKNVQIDPVKELSYPDNLVLKSKPSEITAKLNNTKQGIDSGNLKQECKILKRKGTKGDKSGKNCTSINLKLAMCKNLTVLIKKHDIFNNSTLDSETSKSKALVNAYNPSDNMTSQSEISEAKGSKTYSINKYSLSDDVMNPGSDSCRKIRKTSHVIQNEKMRKTCVVHNKILDEKGVQIDLVKGHSFSDNLALKSKASERRAKFINTKQCIDSGKECKILKWKGTKPDNRGKDCTSINLGLEMCENKTDIIKKHDISDTPTLDCKTSKSKALVNACNSSDNMRSQSEISEVKDSETCSINKYSLSDDMMNPGSDDCVAQNRKRRKASCVVQNEKMRKTSRVVQNKILDEKSVQIDPVKGRSLRRVKFNNTKQCIDCGNLKQGCKILKRKGTKADERKKDCFSINLRLDMSKSKTDIIKKHESFNNSTLDCKTSESKALVNVYNPYDRTSQSEISEVKDSETCSINKYSLSDDVMNPGSDSVVVQNRKKRKTSRVVQNKKRRKTSRVIQNEILDEKNVQIDPVKELSYPDNLVLKSKPSERKANISNTKQCIDSGNLKQECKILKRESTRGDERGKDCTSINLKLEICKNKTDIIKKHKISNNPTLDSETSEAKGSETCSINNYSLSDNVTNFGSDTLISESDVPKLDDDKTVHGNEHNANLSDNLQLDSNTTEKNNLTDNSTPKSKTSENKVLETDKMKKYNSFNTLTVESAEGTQINNIEESCLSDTSTLEYKVSENKLNKTDNMKKYSSSDNLIHECANGEESSLSGNYTTQSKLSKIKNPKTGNKKKYGFSDNLTSVSKTIGAGISNAEENKISDNSTLEPKRSKIEDDNINSVEENNFLESSKLEPKISKSKGVKIDVPNKCLSSSVLISESGISKVNATNSSSIELLNLPVNSTLEPIVLISKITKADIIKNCGPYNLTPESKIFKLKNAKNNYLKKSDPSKKFKIKSKVCDSKYTKIDTKKHVSSDNPESELKMSTGGSDRDDIIKECSFENITSKSKPLEENNSAVVLTSCSVMPEEENILKNIMYKVHESNDVTHSIKTQIINSTTIETITSNWKGNDVENLTLQSETCIEKDSDTQSTMIQSKTPQEKRNGLTSHTLQFDTSIEKDSDMESHILQLETSKENANDLESHSLVLETSKVKDNDIGSSALQSETFKEKGNKVDSSTLQSEISKEYGAEPSIKKPKTVNVSKSKSTNQKNVVRESVMWRKKVNEPILTFTICIKNRTKTGIISKCNPVRTNAVCLEKLNNKVDIKKHASNNPPSESKISEDNTTNARKESSLLESLAIMPKTQNKNNSIYGLRLRSSVPRENNFMKNEMKKHGMIDSPTSKCKVYKQEDVRDSIKNQISNSSTLKSKTSKHKDNDMKSSKMQLKACKKSGNNLESSTLHVETSEEKGNDKESLALQKASNTENSILQSETSKEKDNNKSFTLPIEIFKEKDNNVEGSMMQSRRDVELSDISEQKGNDIEHSTLQSGTFKDKGHYRDKESSKLQMETLKEKVCNTESPILQPYKNVESFTLQSEILKKKGNDKESSTVQSGNSEEKGNVKQSDISENKGNGIEHSTLQSGASKYKGHYEDMESSTLQMETLKEKVCNTESPMLQSCRDVESPTLHSEILKKKGNDKESSTVQSGNSEEKGNVEQSDISENKGNDIEHSTLQSGTSEDKGHYRDKESSTLQMETLKEKVCNTESPMLQPCKDMESSTLQSEILKKKGNDMDSSTVQSGNSEEKGNVEQSDISENKGNGIEHSTLQSGTSKYKGHYEDKESSTLQMETLKEKACNTDSPMLQSCKDVESPTLHSELLKKKGNDKESSAVQSGNSEEKGNVEQSDISENKGNDIEHSTLQSGTSKGKGQSSTLQMETLKEKVCNMESPMLQPCKDVESPTFQFEMLEKKGYDMDSSTLQSENSEEKGNDKENLTLQLETLKGNGAVPLKECAFDISNSYRQKDVGIDIIKTYETIEKPTLQSNVCVHDIIKEHNAVDKNSATEISFMKYNIVSDCTSRLKISELNNKEINSEKYNTVDELTLDSQLSKKIDTEHDSHEVSFERTDQHNSHSGGVLSSRQESESANLGNSATLRSNTRKHKKKFKTEVTQKHGTKSKARINFIKKTKSLNIIRRNNQEPKMHTWNVTKLKEDSSNTKIISSGLEDPNYKQNSTKIQFEDVFHETGYSENDPFINTEADILKPDLSLMHEISSEEWNIPLASSTEHLLFPSNGNTDFTETDYMENYNGSKDCTKSGISKDGDKSDEPENSTKPDVIKPELINIPLDDNGDMCIREGIDDSFIVFADDTVPQLEISFSQQIDMKNVLEILKECIMVTSPLCHYCKHAKNIIMNCKQLILHMLSKHRFKISISTEFGINMKDEDDDDEDLVAVFMDSMEEIKNKYFSVVKNDNKNKKCIFDTNYECLNCSFETTIYKELYLHIVNIHNTTCYKCIMCCNDFNSYIHLMCHRCSGVNSKHTQIQFRCFVCGIDNLLSVTELTQHLKECNKNCSICLGIIEDEKNNEHFISLQSPTSESTNEEFVCIVCCACFSNYDELRSHSVSHLDETYQNVKCITGNINDNEEESLDVDITIDDILDDKESCSNDQSVNYPANIFEDQFSIAEILINNNHSEVSFTETGSANKANKDDKSCSRESSFSNMLTDNRKTEGADKSNYDLSPFNNIPDVIESIELKTEERNLLNGSQSSIDSEYNIAGIKIPNRSNLNNSPLWTGLPNGENSITHKVSLNKLKSNNSLLSTGVPNGENSNDRKIIFVRLLKELQPGINNKYIINKMKNTDKTDFNNSVPLALLPHKALSTAKNISLQNKSSRVLNNVYMVKRDSSNNLNFNNSYLSTMSSSDKKLTIVKSLPNKLDSSTDFTRHITLDVLETLRFIGHDYCIRRPEEKFMKLGRGQSSRTIPYNPFIRAEDSKFLISAQLSLLKKNTGENNSVFQHGVSSMPVTKVSGTNNTEKTHNTYSPCFTTNKLVKKICTNTDSFRVQNNLLRYGQHDLFSSGSSGNEKKNVKRRVLHNTQNSVDVKKVKRSNSVGGKMKMQKLHHEEESAQCVDFVTEKSTRSNNTYEAQSYVPNILRKRRYSTHIPKLADIPSDCYFVLGNDSSSKITDISLPNRSDSSSEDEEDDLDNEPLLKRLSRIKQNSSFSIHNYFELPRKKSKISTEEETDKKGTRDEGTLSDEFEEDDTKLYCYCRSYYNYDTKMIGCDASDCEFQWFHFDCVGVDIAPKGKWFCPDCRKKVQMG